MMEKSFVDPSVDSDAVRERLALDNLNRIEERIALACASAGRKREDVTLLAVTKTVPPRRSTPLLGRE